ncbi:MULTISPECIES: alpha/beta fold hydrolase [unclassified Leucobacter]|uniref:alpha/beta fold hydrolase n=1 Tax=unclassified Leucobacter TaxID=2621730 RepID=UPI00165E9A7F|nr:MULTISPECIES: alpha/beta hydrolase [unclassified Leucobacter]MBC9936501.1 alpha/beta fold hydrolase [Leucobacter sp. cx-87]
MSGSTRTDEFDSGIASANGAELYYELRGSGPTLVLIPGASGDAGMFSRAADELARDFRVLTYDRRGNSRSVAPEGWDTTTVEEQAADVAALIAALDLGPAFVFGNSSGATIALGVALRHPEVLRAVVAHEPPKIGTLPNRDEFLAGLVARMRAAIDRGGYAAAVEDFHGWLVGEGEEDQPELRARVQGNGENWIERELGVIDRYDPAAELIAERTAPLTVGIGTAGGTELHTELLATYRAALVALAAQYGAEFAEFSGAHVPYETMPAVFAAELTAVLRAMA